MLPWTLTPRTMKLLRSIKRDVTKNENSENVPYLEITEVVLKHYNVVNNSYQQNSRVLYTFVPNKSFGQLLNISPENFIFLKIFDSKFLWFRIFIKRYGLLPFAKSMGENIGKNVSKNLISKYSQKILDHAEQSATDRLKTASKKRCKKRQKQPVVLLEKNWWYLEKKNIYHQY